MAHVRVPSQTLRLEYPTQNYIPFCSFTSPNEPLLEKLRAKITSIVKRKLGLGDKFPQDGIAKMFNNQFKIKEGERLLQASQCYISTTAGPILGFLFISTHKIAFCSKKPIMFSSKTGECVNIHYKVVIPVGKLSSANERRNAKRPTEKYIEIVTVDNFDFWFLRLHSHQKTLKYLLQSKFQVQ